MIFVFGCSNLKLIHVLVIVFFDGHLSLGRELESVGSSESTRLGDGCVVDNCWRESGRARIAAL